MSLSQLYQVKDGGLRGIWEMILEKRALYLRAGPPDYHKETPSSLLTGFGKLHFLR